MKWIDVRDSDWFFSEIVDASALTMEDGQAFVAGIGYNIFEPTAPYVYEEIVATEGQKIFGLSKRVNPTEDNPLRVHIDGVETKYEVVADNNVTGFSDVILYYPVRAGAIVTFTSYGKPALDKFGKPVPYDTPFYPKYQLRYSPYYFDPFNRNHSEYVYAFGRQLRRGMVDDSRWNSYNGYILASEFIGSRDDVYIINPNTGEIFLPYNLVGVTCTIQYVTLDRTTWVMEHHEENFKATATRVLHTNRFFPEAKITRAEAFVLMDRLRKYFYSRFTDMDAPSHILEQTIIAEEGQTVFRLNGTFPVNTGLLDVKVDEMFKLWKQDYEETDSHTITMKQPMNGGEQVYFYFKKYNSNRFQDVGTNAKIKVFGSPDPAIPVGDWWEPHVMALEDEKLSTGQSLISGVEVNNFDAFGNILVDEMYNPINGNQPEQLMFMPLSLLTRAEAVTFLNRFRKWCIEKLKL